MKTILILLVGLLFSISVTAQNTITLTVTLKGNQNLQLIIDDRDYTPETSTAGIANNTTVTITDLKPGQHTLEVIRENDDDVNTTFILREDYDKKIVVTASGALQQSEIRSRTAINAKTPMADAQFRILVQSVQNARGSYNKRIAIRNAFANANNFFTTAQASRLIQMVTSEAHRLELAKASYRSITDPANFSRIYNLLNSVAGRNELLVYVNNYNSSNAGYIGRVPMTDADYSTLYQNIQAQYSQSSRMSHVASAFTNITNFFTTYQVKQLLLLLSDERNRLELAKLSYRGITDPGNFHQIYDVFNTTTSRNELATYVRTFSQNKTPMSTATFNSIYQNIRNQSVGIRTSSIANMFNDLANFYTTSQARQLILLVSSEADRLSLAKLSYRGITDPANFNRIHDVLNSQNSRNELTAYVNSFNGGAVEISKTPMTDAVYSALYQNIQAEYSQSTRMSLVANAFTSNTNYFTTYQVKQLLLLLNDERNRLDLAKLSYRGVTDPGNFNQIYDVLSTSSSRNELATYVRSFNQNKAPMSTASFNSMYQEIRNQSISMRTSSIANVFTDIANFYTTSQARQLILLVSSEADRLTLAKLSYRGITDPDNFTLIYDVLKSQSSRNELTAHVNSFNGGTGNVSPTPMSVAEFNSLYSSVANTWGFGAKFSRLTEIFANASYYFTTDQAERLIRLVSSETNRLQLAKAAYSHITDPANFSQLYDVLTTQASRDELDAYVKNSNVNTGNDNGDVYNNPYRIPMADADFTALYTRISNTFGFGAKFSELNDVFSNASNFFTVAQTEKLIRLVSSESNRLHLAKVAYSHITDPANFADLYDMFSSQASVNELKAYVNSNSQN